LIRPEVSSALGALSLTITETVLVFAGIPLAVVAAVYAAVYGTTARRADKRYRPGRPFTFTPVWFLSSPGPLADGRSGAPAVTGTPARPALSPAELPGDNGHGENELEPALAQHGETGGASDSW
jgi:hypothetical protein